MGLKRACCSIGVGLRRHIALHRASLVREEWLRVGGIRFHPRFAESEIGLEPLEIARKTLPRDEQRELLQVLESLDPLVGVRDQDF